MLTMDDITKAKVDQLIADDLMLGPKTITVEKAVIKGGEQPLDVFYVGCEGRPFRPCLSMRRLMKYVWGDDHNTYAGRKMTLYRDASASFGAQKNIGGVRISHMDGLDAEKTFLLTKKKGQKDPYTVKPLQATKQPDPKPTTNSFDFDAYEFKVDQFLPHAETFEELDLFWRNMTADRKAAAGADQDRATKTREKVEARLKELKEV